MDGKKENGGSKMTFELPKLDYAYDALEPWIDAKTMEIHHTKHHQAYIDKANGALSGKKEWENRSVEEILKNLDKLPADISSVVRNNAGGHFNHALFWKIMAPKAPTMPKGELARALQAAFGSVDEFKKKFQDAALNRFGSGWAWLVIHDGKLEITSTANQDSPLSEKKTPVLGLDVWEHAYYIKYQNKRADYVTAWWNVVNWNQVEKNYLAGLKK